MNQIKEYKGCGEYSVGISRYSVNTSVYLFEVKETGYVNEEGEKEKSYLLYEFPSSMPLSTVRDMFIDTYMKYVGYDNDKIVIATSMKDDPSSGYVEMLYAKLKAWEYADLIHNPGTIDYAKQVKNIKITAYDKSSSVNGLFLDGEQIWLDKNLRVGLMNSINIEKSAGRKTTTLWFGGKSYTLPCDMAIQMLSALELYALECYNVTAQHKANVEALTTKEEVEAYDYTTGYPSKLNLSTTTV